MSPSASLAFANKEKGEDLKNSQWIVYDLGGGTFDVALIRIVEGELKVIDHLLFVGLDLVFNVNTNKRKTVAELQDLSCD